MSAHRDAGTYYADRLPILKDLFGAARVGLEGDRLVVEGRRYPIVEDVILLLEPSQYPAALKRRLGAETCADASSRVSTPAAGSRDFAEEIQFTFGEEWRRFARILPEHEREFRSYFDLVDLPDLAGRRVCDLGCGIGRWSYFLKDKCRELVLVDFSEAIFVARRNLAGAGNALFFMGDLTRLPFRDAFADFIFCLGVLHHLRTPALEEVRALRKYAPRLLVYLYYALDNRPFYFRLLLRAVTGLRLALSSVRQPALREGFSWAAALGLYLPLLLAGRALRPLGLSRHVPLYEVYHGKGLERIRQDAYDRFFTPIEQRFTHAQILGLADAFAEVSVSNHPPYWHFLCRS